MHEEKLARSVFVFFVIGIVVIGGIYCLFAAYPFIEINVTVGNYQPPPTVTIELVSTTGEVTTYLANRNSINRIDGRGLFGNSDIGVRFTTTDGGLFFTTLEGDKIEWNGVYKMILELDEN